MFHSPADLGADQVVEGGRIEEFRPGGGIGPKHRQPLFEVEVPGTEQPADVPVAVVARYPPAVEFRVVRLGAIGEADSQIESADDVVVPQARRLDEPGEAHRIAEDHLVLRPLLQAEVTQLPGVAVPSESLQAEPHARFEGIPGIGLVDGPAGRPHRRDERRFAAALQPQGLRRERPADVRTVAGEAAIVGGGDRLDRFLSAGQRCSAGDEQRQTNELHAKIHRPTSLSAAPGGSDLFCATAVTVAPCTSSHGPGIPDLEDHLLYRRLARRHRSHFGTFRTTPANRAAFHGHLRTARSAE